MVGETTSRILARHFGEIEKLQAAGPDELTEVEGIGETIAQSITDFFRDPVSLETIARLQAAGIRFRSEAPARLSSILEGKRIVVTGVFSSPGRRKELEEMVALHGGRLVASVSKNTSFILAGENMGPEKQKKAQELNIPVLSEAGFMDLIRGS